MAQSNFSYRASLERARKVTLDSYGTDFQAPTAQEQAANSSQGLMRPRQRPQEPQGGFVAGFGLGLMKSLIPPEKSPVRPQARPGSERQPDPTSNNRPRSRDTSSRSVQSQVYNGLLDRGVSDHIAQGFMSNFADESAFDIDVTEAEANVHGTYGRGLYQLTGDRRTNFEARYGEDYSIDNQLDWLVDHELNGTESSAWAKIQATTTAGEAADSIVRNFLRPAASHRNSRSAKYLDGSGLWSR